MIKQHYLDRLWNGHLQEDFLSAYDAVGQTGIHTDTHEVEQDILKHVNRKYCVAVANGTDALTILLKAKNYPKGSRIVVPAYSYIATATAVKLAGHEPVYHDVNYDYQLNTKYVPFTDAVAIIVVGLFGRPTNLTGDKFHGMDIIEDAAQSFGADRGGELGIASTFSFSPTKPCPIFGSGGAIVTDDRYLAYKCRDIRRHGREYGTLGQNSLMSSMEAAQLSVCLKQKDFFQKRRKEIAKFYNDNLIHGQPEYVDGHSWSKYVVRVGNVEELVGNNIVQLVSHYPKLLHEETVTYAKMHHTPVAKQLSNESISLPIDPYMMQSEMERVVEFMNKESYLIS